MTTKDSYLTEYEIIKGIAYGLFTIQAHPNSNLDDRYSMTTCICALDRVSAITLFDSDLLAFCEIKAAYHSAGKKIEMCVSGNDGHCFVSVMTYL